MMVYMMGNTVEFFWSSQKIHIFLFYERENR